MGLEGGSHHDAISYYPDRDNAVRHSGAWAEASNPQTLVVPSSYRGPLLIRGRDDLSTRDPLGLSALTSAHPIDRIEIPRTARRPAGRWRRITFQTWLSDNSNCGGYQIDGRTFSETIIFKTNLQFNVSFGSGSVLP